MKIAINDCFGGFSLSAVGVARLAELKGKTAYFYKETLSPNLSERGYRLVMIADCEDTLFWSAFDRPDWHKLTADEQNALYKAHQIADSPSDRTDPDLITVIEELGDKASGRCASLKVIEIPDGVQWEVEEYDGNEWVAEKHRTWRAE